VRQQWAATLCALGQGEPLFAAEGPYALLGGPGHAGAEGRAQRSSSNAGAGDDSSSEGGAGDPDSVLAKRLAGLDADGNVDLDNPLNWDLSDLSDVDWGDFFGGEGGRGGPGGRGGRGGASAARKTKGQPRRGGKAGGGGGGKGGPKGPRQGARDRRPADSDSEDFDAVLAQALQDIEAGKHGKAGRRGKQRKGAVGGSADAPEGSGSGSGGVSSAHAAHGGDSDLRLGFFAQAARILSPAALGIDDVKDGGDAFALLSGSGGAGGCEGAPLISGLSAAERDPTTGALTDFGVLSICRALDASLSADPSLCALPAAAGAPASRVTLRVSNVVPEAAVACYEAMKAEQGGVLSPSSSDAQEALSARLGTLRRALEAEEAWDKPRWATQIQSFGKSEFQLGYTTSSDVQIHPRQIEFLAPTSDAPVPSSVPSASASPSGAAASFSWTGTGSGHPTLDCRPIAFATAKSHSLLLNDRGEVFGWGVANGARLGGIRSASGSSAADRKETKDKEPASRSNQNRRLDVVINPTRIPLGRHKVASISTADRHSLLVTVSGELYAFGDNATGACGFSAPAGLLGSMGANSAPPSHLSSAAVAAAANVNTIISSPRRVEGALKKLRVVAASAGPYHSFCVTSDRCVWAFGSNLTGQLGIKEIPTASAFFSNELLGFSSSSSSSSSAFRAAAAAAAVFNSGHVASGVSGPGQGPLLAGTGTQMAGQSAHERAKTRVPPEILYACTCWGPRKADISVTVSSQGGTGAVSSFLLPGSSEASSSMKPHMMAQMVAAGESYTLVLTRSGDVYSAGHGSPIWSRMQFDKTQSDHADALAAYQEGAAQWEESKQQALAPSASPSSAAAVSGKVAAAGIVSSKRDVRLLASLGFHVENVSLEDGGGEVLSRWERQSNTGGLPATVTHISAGRSVAVACDADGGVWTWGEPSKAAELFGQGIGVQKPTGANTSDPTSSPGAELVRTLTGGTWTTPTRLSSFSRAGARIVRVSAGINHILAVSSCGNAYSWGDAAVSEKGYLGHGSGKNALASIPRRIPGVKGAIDAVAGEFHSLVLTAHVLPPLPPLLPAACTVMDAVPSATSLANVCFDLGWNDSPFTRSSAQGLSPKRANSRMAARDVPTIEHLSTRQLYADLPKDLTRLAKVLPLVAQTTVAADMLGGCSLGSSLGCNIVPGPTVTPGVTYVVPSLKSFCERALAKHVTLSTAPSWLSLAAATDAYGLGAYCGTIINANADIILANLYLGQRATHGHGGSVRDRDKEILTEFASELVSGAWLPLQRLHFLREQQAAIHKAANSMYRAMKRHEYELLRPASAWRALRNRGPMHEPGNAGVAGQATSALAALAAGVRQGVLSVIGHDVAVTRQKLFPFEYVDSEGNTRNDLQIDGVAAPGVTSKNVAEHDHEHLAEERISFSEAYAAIVAARDHLQASGATAGAMRYENDGNKHEGSASTHYARNWFYQTSGGIEIVSASGRQFRRMTIVSTALPPSAPSNVQQCLDRIGANLVEIGAAPIPGDQLISSAVERAFGFVFADIEAIEDIQAPTHARTIVTPLMIDDGYTLLKRARALRKKLLEATQLAVTCACEYFDNPPAGKGRLTQKTLVDSDLTVSLSADQATKLSRRKDTVQELYTLTPYLASLSKLVHCIYSHVHRQGDEQGKEYLKKLAEFMHDSSATLSMMHDINIAGLTVESTPSDLSDIAHGIRACPTASARSKDPKARAERESIITACIIGGNLLATAKCEMEAQENPTSHGGVISSGSVDGVKEASTEAVTPRSLPAADTRALTTNFLSAPTSSLSSAISSGKNGKATSAPYAVSAAPPAPAIGSSPPVSLAKLMESQAMQKNVRSQPGQPSRSGAVAAPVNKVPLAVRVAPIAPVKAPIMSPAEAAARAADASLWDDSVPTPLKPASAKKEVVPSAPGGGSLKDILEAEARAAKARQQAQSAASKAALSAILEQCAQEKAVAEKEAALAYRIKSAFHTAGSAASLGGKPSAVPAPGVPVARVVPVSSGMTLADIQREQERLKAMQPASASQTSRISAASWGIVHRGPIGGLTVADIQRQEAEAEQKRREEEDRKREEDARSAREREWRRKALQEAAAFAPEFRPSEEAAHSDSKRSAQKKKGKK
jgi:alpha-tubulin suppressor-like RCC1 family protein